MAVTLNAKGTSVPYFTIGKNGTTLYQGSSDPTGSYTVQNGDLWIDTATNALKVRDTGSWTPPSLGPLSFPNSTGSSGEILTSDGAGNLYFSTTGVGSVTTVSVVSTNGFAGSVATASSTPAITLSTTVTGILKGNGTSISAAVAGDFPTLNQNTTGSAASLTTGRSITATGDASWTVTFDGTTDVSAGLTLATVNSNTGSWGSASSVPTFTVNAKGLITAVSDTSIQIAESQITDGTILARVGANETITGNWTFNNPVIGADPTVASNFATKQYVDNAVAGLTWKTPVLVATTANITLSGLQTIDGVSVTAGNRVLVKNQSSSSQNGIYIAASGAWSRSTDFDSITPIDEINGAAVFVTAGSTQSDTGWTETATVTAVGTDPITFVQFSAAGAYTAGAGLSLTGNTFNVGTASSSRIVVNVDDIDLATVADSGTGTFLKLTRDSYGRVSGTTAVVASDITGLVDNTYVNVSGDTMTGNLIISPATGNTNLDVRAASGFIAAARITGNGLVSGTTSFDLQQDSTGAVDIVNRSNTRMSFYTNAAERMRLDSSGNLLVGGTTAYGKLDVTGVVHINTTNTITGGYIQALGDTELSYAGGAQYNSYSAPDYIFTARSTSASGYRTANGTHTWWGNTGLTSGNTFTSTERMTLSAAGNLTVSTGGLTSPNTNYDNIAISANGNSGITIISGTGSTGGLIFQDSTDGVLAGRIQYSHSTDTMNIYAGASVGLTMTATDLSTTNTLTTTNTARFNGATQGFIGVLDGTATGVTANASADSLVIDGTNDNGISILTDNAGTSYLMFGDGDDSYIGGVRYVHTSDTLGLFANNTYCLSLTDTTATWANGCDPVLGSTTEPSSTTSMGFRGIPQLSKSANYTLVLSDAGKHIYHPLSDTAGRTFTIPANASVAFPIGTTVTFVNMDTASCTIAITTDTMYLAGPGTTGSRTLAQYGIATAIKTGSTEWLISGTNLT